MAGDAHWFGPRSESSFGSGHPVMFGKPQPAQHFTDMPDGGGYPKGFVEWALRLIVCEDHWQALRVIFPVEVAPSTGTDCAKCEDAHLATLPSPQNLMRRMIVCPLCGNKRCPKATDHDLDCTGSNEPGQPGSRYSGLPSSLPVASEQPGRSGTATNTR